MSDFSPPLLTAEQLFRLFATAVTDYAFILLDRDNRVTGWNPGAEHVLGYAEAEILGQSGQVFFTPEDCARGAADAKIQMALHEGRATDERWHVRKTGTRFWGSGVMTPLRDDPGQLQGFAKVMRDETRQHILLESLHESEQRLQLAQAIAGAGTGVTQACVTSVRRRKTLIPKRSFH